MTRLLLIRHGETEWNRSGRWQGMTDIPLTDEGRAQAEALAARFCTENVHVDHIYASDLSRALETAQIVAAAFNKSVHPLPELREINVGAWAGLTRMEILAQFPHAFHSDEPPPGGEHRREFANRVSTALLRLVEQHPNQTLMIVTHGGAVRAMVRRLYELAGQRDLPVPFIGNTSITEIHFDGNTWHFVRINDTAHVADNSAPDMLAPTNESATT